MLDWLFSGLKQFTAEMVFLIFTLIGLCFSAGSLILGGHDADHDTDHDAGGDHDQDDHGSGHGVINFSSMLSIRGLSLMATGFGSFGYITMHFSHKILLSSVVGVMGAFALAIPALALVEVFFKQQASSLVSADELVGCEGNATLTIPAAGNGRGEVVVYKSGARFYKPATTQDVSAIPSGTPVRVVRATPDLLIVTRAL